MFIYNMMNIVMVFLIREMVRYFKDMREFIDIENYILKIYVLRENIVKWYMFMYYVIMFWDIINRKDR